MNDLLVEVPDFSPHVRGVLWETWALDRGVFITYDEDKIYTYMYSKEHVMGKFLSVYTLYATCFGSCCYMKVRQCCLSLYLNLKINEVLI